MFPLPYGEIVTRLRAGLIEDPYSTETTQADWGDEDNPPTELDIPGCAFDPGVSLEPLEPGRDAVRTTPTVYAPPDADITARDRLVVRGRTWNVDGDPADWRSPFTGWHPGLSIPLTATEG